MDITEEHLGTELNQLLVQALKENPEIQIGEFIQDYFKQIVSLLEKF